MNEANASQSSSAETLEKILNALEQSMQGNLEALRPYLPALGIQDSQLTLLSKMNASPVSKTGMFTKFSTTGMKKLIANLPADQGRLGKKYDDILMKIDTIIDT